MNKRTSLLFKRLDVLGLEHNFSTDHTLSDDQLKNIQKRLSKDSSGYKIIMYRNPKTLEEFNDILIESFSYGKRVCLEKYTCMYGKEKGIELYKELNLSKAMTLENMIKKYGEIEGNNRWKIYCDKQAYTNTFEYKNKKYGMTKEEFDSFNSSRAITLENMIKKYGEIEGNNRWKIYCDKQAYTNTKEYLGDRYEEVNKKKSNSIENMIKKYGEIEGHKKFIERAKKSTFYSKKSQDLFLLLEKCVPFKDKKCYYATKNGEYGLYDKLNNSYKMYDFVCVELKLCIEFNGDHYHGNPKIYSPNDFLKGKGQSKVTASEAWANDSYKNNLMKKERDINVIVVWENDWDSDKQSVIDRICEYASKIQR